MLRQSTETYILWMTIALGIGVVISLLAGLAELSHARKLPFFLLRRQAIERGWRNILIGIIFLLIGLAANIGGRPMIELVVPPTLTPTVSPTPTPPPPPPPPPPNTHFPPVPPPPAPRPAHPLAHAPAQRDAPPRLPRQPHHQ